MKTRRQFLIRSSAAMAIAATALQVFAERTALAAARPDAKAWFEFLLAGESLLADAVGRARGALTTSTPDSLKATLTELDEQSTYHIQVLRKGGVTVDMTTFVYPSGSLNSADSATALLASIEEALARACVAAAASIGPTDLLSVVTAIGVNHAEHLALLRGQATAISPLSLADGQAFLSKFGVSKQ